jgi:hypothetical protein
MQKRKVDDFFFKPRHNCKRFFIEQECKPRCIKLTKFNDLAKKKKFTVGPYKETFGTGYGEPYYPYAQVFGMLEDKGVFAEMHENYRDKVS